MPDQFAATVLVLGLLAAVPAPAIPARDPAPARNPAAGVIEPTPQTRWNRSSQWRAFQARHGPWKAIWNEGAGSPHLAFGPPIALAGFSDDAPGADLAVRGFVTSHPELFGSPVLERVAAFRIKDLWYLSYRQTVRGVPVWFEDWEFRVGAGGGLAAFRADAHRPAGDVPTTPGIVPAVAREAARAALGLPGGVGPVEGGESLCLIPEDRPGGTAYRLAVEVHATASSPPANWVVLVDARTGEVLWRHNRVRHAISGLASAPVHLGLPGDPATVRGMPREAIAVGSDTAFTNGAGAYSAPAAGTVTIAGGLRGAYCAVQRFDGPNASRSTSATAPAVVDFGWNGANSQDSERDGYYHATLAHDWIKAIDPAFTGLDYPMACGVGLGQSCDAFWNGSGIYFYSAGNGCPDMATMRDVVYHEYGHGLNDQLYRQLGQTYGMSNSALQEGLADVLSAFIRDDPVLGRDLHGPGTSERTLVNTRRWPDDASYDPHQAGLIVGGALWDLREALGLSLASRLVHFAMYGRPDGEQDDQAMAEFFLETLLADDDDGNLADGTPHAGSIAAAFNAHGIGTGHFLQIAQVVPDDPPVPGPYVVTASISTLSPLGSVDPAGARIFYSVNGGPYVSVPMMPTATPGEYEGSIPVPQGTIVRYYIRATDSLGGTRTEPEDPTRGTCLFLAGPTTTRHLENAELPNGWSVGWDGDTATSGVWVWGEPFGTSVGLIPCQPEEDHTPTGLMCLFTGNAPVGYPPSYNDVDGGATTLLSPPLDARAAGSDPVVEYYRWFSNDLGGDPPTDRWRVWVSNDLGANWVPVEDTTRSDNSWHRVAFFLRDYVVPTDEVMLRFTAEDAGAPSLVEAAVDDLRLLTFDVPIIGVGAPGGGAAAIRAWPSPFTSQTRIEFTLARPARANVSVHDVAGRVVRRLASGTMAAGSHALAWDGTDEAGRSVPSGLYLVKLEGPGESRVGRVVRIR